MFQSRLLAALMLFTSSHALAETLTLKNYLDLANQGQLNIVYSSDLILPRYSVTFDPSLPISPTSLARLLKKFDLDLRQTSDNSFAIIAIASASETDTANKQASTDDGMFDSSDIEELIVTSSSYKLLLQSKAGRNELDHDSLLNRPALGNDVMHQLNQLPGTSGVGLSAKPRVRGGNDDETLILLDGMALFEPFHFLDLFGSFDARTIESLDFYAGSFDASYGNKVSAVMEIIPRDLAAVDSQKELGIGLYNVSYFQTGGSDDHRFLFNARRSTLNFTTSLAEKDLGEPSYGDLYARYEWDKSVDENLSVNLFLFGDDLSLNTPSGEESSERLLGSAYLWLNHNLQLNDRLNVSSVVGLSSLHSDRAGSVEKDDFVTGRLEDDREFYAYHLQQQYQYSTTEQVLTFGWNAKYLQSEYRFNSNRTIDPRFVPLSPLNTITTSQFETDLEGYLLGGFVSFKNKLTTKLSTEIGLRYDLQGYQGDTRRNQISPRLAFHYRLNPETTIRIGMGKFSQAQSIHELKVSDGLTNFQNPQTANHFVLGLDHQFSFDAKLRLELYQKRGAKVSDYFENLTTPLSLVPELQPDRVRVSASSYRTEGIEISYQQQFKNIEYWGNYSYANAEDRINGQSKKRTWHQAHAVNLGASLNYFDWQFSILGEFHEGWRTTVLNFDTALTQVQASERNNNKLSNYQSWAIKASREWQTKNNGFRVEMGFSNLFNRENQIGTEYNLNNNMGISTLEGKAKNGLPLAPFFDIFWRF